MGKKVDVQTHRGNGQPDRETDQQTDRWRKGSYADRLDRDGQMDNRGREGKQADGVKTNIHTTRAPTIQPHVSV